MKSIDLTCDCDLAGIIIVTGRERRFFIIELHLPGIKGLCKGSGAVLVILQLCLRDGNDRNLLFPFFQRDVKHPLSVLVLIATDPVVTVIAVRQSLLIGSLEQVVVA